MLICLISFFVLFGLTVVCYSLCGVFLVDCFWLFGVWRLEVVVDCCFLLLFVVMWFVVIRCCVLLLVVACWGFVV